MIAIDSDAVWVETLRQSTCGSCAAQKGCGHGLLNRLGGGKRHYIRVLPGTITPQDCQVGDQVSFAIPETVILRGSMLVYVMPLLAMLGAAAAAAGTFPAQQDLAALAGAGFGFTLGVSAVRWHASRHQQDPALQPTLVEHRSSPLQTIELA